MTERESDKRRSNSIEEIDLFELIGLFKAKKRVILNWTITFAVIGLLVALTSRTEYTAYSKLLPESSASGALNLGGLGGLAGLAGINLDASQSGVMSPDIYPEIVNSLPFIIEASNEELYFKQKNQEYSSFHYFKEIQDLSFGELVLKYTLGLPGLIREVFSDTRELELETADGRFLTLSKEDRKILDSFSDRIVLDIDLKTGIIKLTVDMPDPYAAADLAHSITNLLMNRIIEYKVEKAKLNLSFIEERHLESKNIYEQRLADLARYSDRNVNVVSSVAQIETQRLQNEVDVTFGVFKELATQLEQAKIQVKEQTPVLTVLEPPAVPTEKSRPKRLIIFVVCSMAGFFVAISIILTKHIFISNAK